MSKNRGKNNLLIIIESADFYKYYPRCQLISRFFVTWFVFCSNNQKLQNPMEFSTTKVIARPLPKYVTEAKQKFVFGDDDHEMMEATETKINPFSFPISRRYFSFPTSASLGKRQDYVVFTQKNKYTNSRKKQFHSNFLRCRFGRLFLIFCVF